MTGSRDPIREYIERRQRQERNDRIARVLTWFAMALSAGIMAFVVWAMLTVVLTVYG